MNIFNKEPRKIRCIRNDKEVLGGGLFADRLTVGKLYTFEYADIGGFSTMVVLKEFPGMHFNSVLFEEVECPDFEPKEGD